MILNRRTEPLASPTSLTTTQQQAHNASRPASPGGEVLLERLFQCFQACDGRTGGVAERICQELSNASQGLLSLRLFQGPAVEEMVSAPPVSLTLRVAHHRRWYGTLHVTTDILEPGHATISSMLASMIAHYCALHLFDLEVTTLIQGMLSSTTPPRGVISDREQEVLDLLCSGASRKQAAEALGIVPLTLGKHINNLYYHLGVHSERDLIIAAFVLGQYYPIAGLNPRVIEEGSPVPQGQT